MAIQLRADNFSATNIKQQTKLNADYAAGIATFTVENNADIVANSILYVGRLGSESCEKLVILSVSGATSITTTTNSVLPHSRFDDITIVYGDKLKVYKAANVNGTAPAEAAFTTSLTPVTIQADRAYTDITDTTGSSDYWYRFTYYNSISATETNLADSSSVRGGGYGNYVAIEAIRDEAGLANNIYITDSIIDKARQEAKALIHAELSGLYTLPFTEPVNPLITLCNKLLAAGYLLTKDYGVANTQNTNEGQAKINRVTNPQKTGYLDRLNTKDLVITSQDGTDTSIVGTASSMSGWPDGTTADADEEDGGGGFLFTMKTRY